MDITVPHRPEVVALGDDDVRIPLRGLHELQVHRPHRRQILPPDRIEVATPLVDVALQPAHDTKVGVSVYIDLQVHQIPQRRFVQDQDPLDEDHRSRRDAHGLATAIVHGKVVTRSLHGHPTEQRPQMGDE